MDDFINESRDSVAASHFSDLLGWLNARHMPTAVVPLLQLGAESFALAHCDHATASERMLGAIAYAVLLHTAFDTIQHPIPTMQFSTRDDIIGLLDDILSLRDVGGGPVSDD